MASKLNTDKPSGTHASPVEGVFVYMHVTLNSYAGNTHKDIGLWLCDMVIIALQSFKRFFITINASNSTVSIYLSSGLALLYIITSYFRTFFFKQCFLKGYCPNGILLLFAADVKFREQNKCFSFRSYLATLV